ncbi:helix-turn-helix domain-containing protein [Amycolatopsis aidingensis]|uniref:DNA-binding response regulator n=1 Tax=Amycolatopsis aidingensis TaxID=2842453 RepID=UPI001C0DBF84|nr:DNA-binding response regulator [Amycolatopsis aidingensis]
MERTGDVVVLRGERELFQRAGHLLTTADEVCCAANDLFTWAAGHTRWPDAAAEVASQHARGRRIRKVYRPGALLDPSSAQHLRQIERAGARIRITQDELNETIIIDRRLAVLAGDLVDGARSYSVITRPEVVQGVTSLFEAAWRAATDLAGYDARFAELRAVAPRILELLAAGCKDEAAARTLGLGLRTYRRRVAELMDALGAESRFQAGARARELGLI